MEKENKKKKIKRECVQLVHSRKNIVFDHGVSNNKNKINCKREIMGSFRTHATSIL